MTGIIKEMQQVLNNVLNNESQAKQAVYALIKTFGGERIYLPRYDYIQRNQEILDLYMAGATLEQIASTYRLAPKTVRRILEHIKH